MVRAPATSFDSSILSILTGTRSAGHVEKMAPALGEAGAKVDGRNNAEIGMAMMWIRNRPTSIKFRFREWGSDLLVFVDAGRPHGTLSTPVWAACLTNWLRPIL
jgi:hypothetical protein